MTSARIRVTAVAAALVAAGSLAAGTSAVAAPASPAETKTVPYFCRTIENGERVPINGHKRVYDGKAPATVRPGQLFDVVLDPAPTNTNATYLKVMKDVTGVFKLNGAQVVHVRLSGGSGIGTAPPKVTVSGGKVTVVTPGPIPGGQEYDLPTVTVTLRAPYSGTVTSVPGGTSFDDLGFFFSRQVVGSEEWGPGQCYPDPAQPVVFTSTAIGY